MFSLDKSLPKKKSKKWVLGDGSVGKAENGDMHQ